MKKLTNISKKIIIYFNKITNVSEQIKRLRNISKIISKSKKAEIIVDFYGTAFDKNLLLVYIVEPFLELRKDYFRHTNFKEARFISLAGQAAGFNIDIVPYNMVINSLDYSKYDLFVGFGISLENSFYKLTNVDTKRILYGTGQNTIISNEETVFATQLEKKIYNHWMAGLSRAVPWSWPFQLLCSDVIVALGNEFVKSTYLKTVQQKNWKLENKVININCFYHSGIECGLTFLVERLNTYNPRHLCWFGSTGAIHKGLLVTIRAVQELRKAGYNLMLDIFGLQEGEMQEVQKVIKNFQGIRFCKLIDLSKDADRLRLQEVSFNVFPSITEGGSPSILNLAVFAGIPTISTHLVGLNSDALGIVLDSNDQMAVVNGILKGISMTKEEYNIMMHRVYNNISEGYTELEYFNNWKQILRNI